MRAVAKKAKSTACYMKSIECTGYVLKCFRCGKWTCALHSCLKCSKCEDCHGWGVHPFVRR